jgi:hypothetical protein
MLKEKEEEILKDVVIFLQNSRNCPKDKKDDFFVKRAFLARNVISFDDDNSKDRLFSESLIYNIIPFLMAKDDGEDINDVAKRIDDAKDNMFDDLLRKFEAEKK